MITDNYQRWNRALCDRLLREAPSEPLYLYTDAELIEEVAPLVGVTQDLAVDTFTAAVRETLTDRDPFQFWRRESEYTRGEAELPSYLAVLCFLVMVGVEQQRPTFSYYPELNALLGTEDVCAPRGFERDVPALFRHFNDWLEGPGARFGTPTATAPEHWPYIGWPLSQALVRPSDRHYLQRIFEGVGLPPGSVPPPADLVARALSRVRASADSSSRSRLLHLHEHDPLSFSAVVRREYTGWAGPHSLGGLPARVNLRLCFDDEESEWWFLVPAVEGLRGRTFEVGGTRGTFPPFKGAEVVPAGLWELLGSGTVGTVELGPRLVSPSAARRWLLPDPRAGGWAEVARRAEGVDQLLLTSPRDAARLEAIGASREGWPCPDLVLLRVPAAMELDDPGGTPPAPAADRPELHGGLPLRARPATFLRAAGAMPTLTCDASLVDAASEVPRRFAAGPLDVEQVPAGSYRLEPGGTPVRFLDRLAEPHESEPPAWLRAAESGDSLLVPWSGGPVWALAADGRAMSLRIVHGTPPWIEEFGCASHAIDVRGRLRLCPFPPAFVVSQFMGRDWVTPVPSALRIENSEEPAPRLDVTTEQELLSRLLVGALPEDVCTSLEWRRALAAFMRAVHR